MVGEGCNDSHPRAASTDAAAGHTSKTRAKRTDEYAGRGEGRGGGKLARVEANRGASMAVVERRT